MNSARRQFFNRIGVTLTAVLAESSPVVQPRRSEDQIINYLRDELEIKQGEVAELEWQLQQKHQV